MPRKLPDLVLLIIFILVIAVPLTSPPTELLPLLGPIGRAAAPQFCDGSRQNHN